MPLSAVILAAGKGTRMNSSCPKVLHKLANKPLITHVYDTAKCLGADEVVVVYGHEGEMVKNACTDFDAKWVEQEQQLGTGHAVQHAIEELNTENKVLILYGDVPLTSEETLNRLLENSEDNIKLLTVELDDPTGYGRIIRQNGKVTAIVEQKDATEEQLKITEVNTGILSCPGTILKELIDQIDNNNSQQEYYLTDIFKLAANLGISIETTQAKNSYEVEGVNNRLQLATLERVYQRNKAEELMLSGVTIADPARIDIRGNVSIDRDVYIDVNVILEGDVKIESGCSIGANSIVINSTLGANVDIKANCVVEDALIKNGCEIGPFARIRPGTELAESAKIGNFVEVKKSKIGKGSKVNHLSYIGDTTMGDEVNVGAGTITCNYDGANKHQTNIGDKVFIGSDSQLVAPVTVGDNATIGAGTTLTKDVEKDQLVISRAPLRSIKDWKRPKKNK